MNDLLKLLSKSLIPLGYHLRPYKGLNFLKIPTLEAISENGENIKFARKSLGSTPSINADQLNELTIVLRTCLREKRNKNPQQRVSGVDDIQNALHCIWSLIRSINHATENCPDTTIRFKILDDRSDESSIEKVKDLLELCLAETNWKTTKTAGQGASLHQQFSDCKSETGMVYCVEDDFLHEENGIARLIHFYQKTAQDLQSHLVIYPQEHTILHYNHYPSYILTMPDGHWRTMRHATHTFMTHSEVVRKNWKLFENTKFVGDKKKRQRGSEAKTTNRLFDKIPGFSPLHPCAVHLQYESLLPPFYDWKKVWEDSALPSDNHKPEKTAKAVK
ncbi:MAG TPA: hypothetical protein PLK94_04665 [Alphaproteobacteria bacterium]|nr:hypothetical protein [Alphaproteobacteria bacterium]HOO50565.1 hypothetical protein [Alphaproteobacteria bacterium]